MSRVLPRWVLVALLLPALIAPGGAAWAWCLCADVLCGCCEPGTVQAEGCCPGEEADPADCGDCGRVAWDVDGLEALLPPANVEVLPLLIGWLSAAASPAVVPAAVVRGRHARAPPRSIPTECLRPGALPLRV